MAYLFTFVLKLSFLDIKCYFDNISVKIFCKSFYGSEGIRVKHIITTSKLKHFIGGLKVTLSSTNISENKCHMTEK